MINAEDKIVIDSMFHKTIIELRDYADKNAREIRDYCDKNLKEYRQEHREDLKEMREDSRSSRRWILGTMITLGFGLATYLTILIKGIV